MRTGTQTSNLRLPYANVEGALGGKQRTLKDVASRFAGDGNLSLGPHNGGCLYWKGRPSVSACHCRLAHGQGQTYLVPQQGLQPCFHRLEPQRLVQHHHRRGDMMRIVVCTVLVLMLVVVVVVVVVVVIVAVERGGGVNTVAEGLQAKDVVGLHPTARGEGIRTCQSKTTPPPRILSPQPSALGPQRSVLSPQPSLALSPLPSPLSPQPSALGHQPSTRTWIAWW